ncbi:16S rRNA (guanine(966)-N(2))-methyltransferase RsmD [Gordonia sp. CPCC 206044]|uniref:16S rRNA (guanine(966)-N(2))-methyltransferase RsmD n=1 Tax=Gordonia sp. CPCC 206044 TaxID=3140793 RepID=UPI003AF3EE8E
MTRIIAGEFRGRRLRVPDEGTRPTSDRVREAVFNIIDARIDLDGARVLDLYAGSGALGLEALSRGAASAEFVDSRRKATTVIAANARACGVERRVRVTARPVATQLAGDPSELFDIVFLDPPYDLDNDAMSADLARVAAAWAAPGALVVVERAIRAAVTEWPMGLRVLVSKTYGDTRVEVAGHD